MNVGVGWRKALGEPAACRLFALLLLIFSSLLLAPTLAAAEDGPDYSKLAPVPPCAALKAVANACQIPLDVLDPPSDSGCLNPGDTFTGLVTLFEKGGRRTQWLVYLTALPASPKELARHTPRSLVLYSGRSNRLEYASSPTMVRLRTLGPFAAGANKGERLKMEDESVTFSLDQGYLGLGLDQAAAVIPRIEAHRTSGAAFWFGSQPPTPQQLAQTRKLDESVKLTPAEERALGGAIPALMSYADVVQHIEVLEGIVEKVVQKPSLWSVIGHLGVSVNFRTDRSHFTPADLQPWGWPANTPGYHFPMLLELNQQLALRATFVVTSPRPPLLACGGIVGLLAEKPGDKETYLTLRVVSARCQHGSVEALKR